MAAAVDASSDSRFEHTGVIHKLGATKILHWMQECTNSNQGQTTNTCGHPHFHLILSCSVIAIPLSSFSFPAMASGKWTRSAALMLCVLCSVMRVYAGARIFFCARMFWSHAYFLRHVCVCVGAYARICALQYIHIPITAVLRRLRER